MKVSCSGLYSHQSYFNAEVLDEIQVGGSQRRLWQNRCRSRWMQYQSLGDFPAPDELDLVPIAQSGSPKHWSGRTLWWNYDLPVAIFIFYLIWLQLSNWRQNSLTTPLFSRIYRLRKARAFWCVGCSFSSALSRSCACWAMPWWRQQRPQHRRCGARRPRRLARLVINDTMTCMFFVTLDYQIEALFTSLNRLKQYCMHLHICLGNCAARWQTGINSTIARIHTGLKHTIFIHKV